MAERSLLPSNEIAERALLGSMLLSADYADLADTIAETWQGDYGLIPEFPPRYTPYTEPLKLMQDLGDWIEKNRAACCDKDDTYLQNEIDNVCTLIRQTQYKLRFLK